jgi:hypothetical protein
VIKKSFFCKIFWCNFLIEEIEGTR